MAAIIVEYISAKFTSDVYMNVLALTRYTELGASSRMRFFQFAELLSQKNINVTFQCLFSDQYISRLYNEGKRDFRDISSAYLHRSSAVRARGALAELLWIEKELMPFVPYFIERILIGSKRYVLDFDDAVFHNYDMGSTVKRKLFGNKLKRLMRSSVAVVGGNAYLAAYARAAGARTVIQIPTAIDMRRYSSRQWPERPPTTLIVGWVGSPATSKYLTYISDALRIAATKIHLKLRVIGDRNVRIPGVEVECREWSELSEVSEIQQFDVGVMPLPDTPWERGKCGYKLIQYMGCGVPVIASPVGINREIIADGVNGFFAEDTAGWVRALRYCLINYSELRRMGTFGRNTVKAGYSLEAIAPKLVDALQTAVGLDACAG